MQQKNNKHIKKKLDSLKEFLPLLYTYNNHFNEAFTDLKGKEVKSERKNYCHNSMFFYKGITRTLDFDE